MNFADTVQFLFSLGPELKTVKWDLKRIEALLAELGSPQRAGRFVHVAGTNGKGSVCAMLESCLRASGLRTGLYTSPHLSSPRERIRIDGDAIEEELWVEVFEQVHAAAERLLAAGKIDAHPSFFESITAMAFLAFERSAVDIVVLETGLGGRLDATNVVDPALSVITPIDFDHEAFLGSSIELIAGEKAGILKPGRPAVFATQRPEALQVLMARAQQLNIRVQHSSSVPVSDVVVQPFSNSFRLGDGNPVTIALAGAHQVENAFTAVAALQVLGIPDTAVRLGLTAACWPGRLELVARNPDIILDGAHNPAGARALASHIRMFFQNEPFRLIYGAMRDKAIEEVTNELFPLAAEVIVTAIDQPRALSPQAVIEMSDHPNMRVAESTAEALRMAHEDPMTTFVSGSLFLVGEARDELSNRR